MSSPIINDVRSYIRANNPLVTDSQVTDAFIASNLTAAVSLIERATGRYFADRPGQTYTYTTEGRPIIELPGLRNVTSVTWLGTALVNTQTYWLIPDTQQTGINTGLQLRPFIHQNSGGSPWLSSPEWFDRNLDSPYYPGNYGGGGINYGSLPNDLVIVGDWGYAAGTEPQAYIDAVLILASYKTLRPGSLLTGATSTPDGLTIGLSGIPGEVDDFIQAWKLSLPQAVGI